MSPSTHDIDRLLPQTQCERCGYAGCKPYADAIAAGEADINRCPPGGAETIGALAELLKQPARPLAPECGEHTPPTVAVIDEDTCIGCTRCIQVCPVDAIVGAAKRMHTVIENECTGCELCLPACPVDCIDLAPVSAPADANTEAAPATETEKIRQRHIPPGERRAADHARFRFEARRARLDAEQRLRDARRREKRSHKNKAARRNEIADMVAAVHARRGERRT